MTSFRVIDPTINADYGIVQARTATAALDYITAKMGWESYAEYSGAAAKHSGTRTLLAVEVRAEAEAIAA